MTKRGRPRCNVGPAKCRWIYTDIFYSVHYFLLYTPHRERTAVIFHRSFTQFITNTKGLEDRLRHTTVQTNKQQKEAPYIAEGPRDVPCQSKSRPLLQPVRLFPFEIFGARLSSYGMTFYDQPLC